MPNTSLMYFEPLLRILLRCTSESTANSASQTLFQIWSFVFTRVRTRVAGASSEVDSGHSSRKLARG